MKKTKYLINKKGRGYGLLSILSIFIVMLVASACKKQLDVKDPNDPTFAGNVNSEAGLAAYAKGGIYWNGLFMVTDGWVIVISLFHGATMN